MQSTVDAESGELGQPREVSPSSSDKALDTFQTPTRDNTDHQKTDGSPSDAMSDASLTSPAFIATSDAGISIANMLEDMGFDKENLRARHAQATGDEWPTTVKTVFNKIDKIKEEARKNENGRLEVLLGDVMTATSEWVREVLAFLLNPSPESSE